MKPRFVYVVKGSLGLIKVGMSCDVAARRNSLRGMFRAAGESIVDMHVVPTPLAFMCEELEAIKEISKIGTCVNGREWFRGISFEKAVEIVSSVVTKHRDRWNSRLASEESKKAAREKLLTERRFNASKHERAIDWTASQINAMLTRSTSA